LEEALTYMICKDILPMNTVEKGFKHFVKVIEPRWNVPTQQTVITWMEKKYSNVKENVNYFRIERILHNGRHMD